MEKIDRKISVTQLRADWDGNGPMASAPVPTDYDYAVIGSNNSGLTNKVDPLVGTVLAATVTDATVTVLRITNHTTKQVMEIPSVGVTLDLDGQQYVGTTAISKAEALRFMRLPHLAGATVRGVVVRVDRPTKPIYNLTKLEVKNGDNWLPIERLQIQQQQQQQQQQPQFQTP